ITAWSIRRAKLGVALAVIKSKPAGQSGREHAEKLVFKLKQQEETWKRKAEELQDQVLSLRQELLLVKLLSKQRKGAESSQGDDVFKLLSQDLIEAQHSENDSGCDTQTLSLTPDPADPAAPRSISFTSSFDRDPRGHVLSKHMRFLQNLCALRSMGRNVHMDRGDAVIEDTAVNMIESIVEAHRAGGEGDVSQLSPLVQASRLVALALERGFGKQGAFEKAEEFLDELLEILLNNSQLNKVAVQDNLTECLICLGGATALRAALVNLVLTRIVRLAEHLWTGCQEVPEGQQPKQVDWVRYENSFYLFWTLEQLIQTGSGRAGTELHHQHQNSHLQTQLEKHVLPLSDEFPLFALYMWRIEGLLK
ncbi:meiosis-specific protein MEI4, partial [Silurus asotus]